MDFLGIGPLELIVILIIAFVVVGPERLPQLAQSIGKTLRDLRALSRGLTTEWQRELSSMAELEPGESLQQTLTQPLKEVQTELKQISSPFDIGEGIQESLTKPFEEARTEAQKALSTPSTSPSAAEPPLEASSSAQPDTAPDDVDHADT
jgi:Tat protein translocase TatB subunit